MTEKENILLERKHVLGLIVDEHCNLDKTVLDDIEFIKNNFCGTVLSKLDDLINHKYSPGTIVYVTGNAEKIYNCIQDISNKIVYVVKELSYNYKNDSDKYELINVGEVPINVNNVGVYFRKFFNDEKDYFDLISSEHEFQILKESNKPSEAYRKGIYLTNVEEKSDSTKFHLLRCSTNLNGPTDNFRISDHEVVNKVNDVCKHFFEEKTELNHVLAQIYQNVIINDNVERKAKIKEHSDKTKDMPRNGLIAFCTFYKNYSNNKFTDEKMKQVKKSHTDSYDYCLNKTSILTKLRFRLKSTVVDPKYVKQFDVTLYPNSVFIISLLMNRLYTHEIVPSILPIHNIPTRLGYVIRCSKTEAVFKDDQTHIVENDKHVKLEKPTSDNVKELKEIYVKENITDDMIFYKKFYFSMNNGDYEKPKV